MIKVKSQKLVAGVLFIFVVAFTLVIFANNARAKYQFEITIKDIEDRIDASLQFDGPHLVNGMPLGLSSNPYDYVKDNAEFQKLVSYGDAILDDLVAMQKDKEKYDSFQRYLLAIAIEEITKTDLKSFDKYM